MSIRHYVFFPLSGAWEESECDNLNVNEHDLGFTYRMEWDRDNDIYLVSTWESGYFQTHFKCLDVSESNFSP